LHKDTGGPIRGGSSASLAGSGDLKKMTERWFKDGSWLKELP
jgi:hypothetical protein